MEINDIDNQNKRILAQNVFMAKTINTTMRIIEHRSDEINVQFKIDNEFLDISLSLWMLHANILEKQKLEADKISETEKASPCKDFLYETENGLREKNLEIEARKIRILKNVEKW